MVPLGERSAMRTWYLAALLGLFLAAPVRAEVDFPPFVTMRVLDEPRVGVVDGERVLCYEILLTNLQDQACRLEELVCLAGETEVGRFDQPALTRSLHRLELGATQDDGTIAPGGSALLFVWLLPSEMPLALSHRLKLKVGDREATLQGASTQVLPGPRQALALPFNRPGLWVAGSGPSNASDHRRALSVLDGEMSISQRFAIDWVIMDEKGNMAREDGSRNEHHYCYGAEALAVADGVVVGVKDGIPQNVPGDSRAVVITPETIGGNWVALDLGPEVHADGQATSESRRYAMYAHLQPGSLRVKPGDKVKKGQVLALVGNTGNSSAPHLHFHMATKADWLRASGLPYLLDEYETMGTIEIPAKQTDPLRITSSPLTRHRDAMPRENAIVSVGAPGKAP